MADEFSVTGAFEKRTDADQSARTVPAADPSTVATPFEEGDAPHTLADNQDPLIITVGLPGRGKSTLLMLMNFAIGRTGKFQRLNGDDGRSVIGSSANVYRTEVLRNWRVAFERGHFPEATESRRPVAADFLVEIKPTDTNQRGGTNQTFRILEVAGERFETNDLGQAQSGEVFYQFLEEQIRTKAGIPKVFLVVVKAGTPEDCSTQDINLSRFLTWAAQMKPRGSFALHPLVVIADPGAALELVREAGFDVRLGSEFGGDAAKHYVSMRFPTVLSQTALMTASEATRDVPCFGLFVGRENSARGVREAGRIAAWDLDHTAAVLDFVYRSVGGRFNRPEAGRATGIDQIIQSITALFKAPRRR